MKKIHCGIYLITNKINNKVYVGSSKNIKQRWKNHKTQLKSGKHHNIILQNTVERIGLDKFNFTVLEECDQLLLLEREIYWIKYYDSMHLDKGYNILEPGKYPVNFKRDTKSLRMKAIEEGKQVELIDIKTLQIIDKLPLLVDICNKYKLNKKKASEALNNEKTSYKGYILQREDKPKNLKLLQERYIRYGKDKTLKSTITLGRTWTKEYIKEYRKNYWENNKHKYSKSHTIH